MILGFNEWKRRHAEGLRQAPFIPCPQCGKKTRMRKNGRFHCRFCKAEARFSRPG